MSEVFGYVSIARSEAQVGYVGFHLRREHGEPFLVIISAEDARRLAEDLTAQARIADKNSN